MSNQDNGGPAFPVMSDVGDAGLVNYHHPGMTLRDWFAGMALQGVLANPTVDYKMEEYVRGAYKIADSMLGARK